VFLHLKRKGEEIFYFKDVKECDFITRSKNRLFTAIQVCYELTETNLDRELNGLVEALKKLSLESGQIVTHNQTDQFLIDGKTIDVVPAWKWME
jgi:predicted AAA+ superfamily ATPase